MEQRQCRQQFGVAIWPTRVFFTSWWLLGKWCTDGCLVVQKLSRKNGELQHVPWRFLCVDDHDGNHVIAAAADVPVQTIEKRSGLG